eukprot:91659-Pleurochrysis_carterae.AAC.1
MVAGLRLPSRGVDLRHRLRLVTAYVALVLHDSPCRCTSRLKSIRQKIGSETRCDRRNSKRLSRKH